LDTDRITQVVMNLLNNAIKFTHPGGVIDVEVSCNHRNAHVSVKDTGIGIMKEDQGKLFQPFVQVDSTDTRKFEGTGLGLSICKGIINNHGGKIWL
jgi:signal transduction histidine kinase